MISVGIIGCSGYTGKKLIQFCETHPFVEELFLYGHASAGKNILEIFPDLTGTVSNRAIENIQDVRSDCDVYFLALPHGEALTIAPKLISSQKLVIDLSGDYRLNDAPTYREWYRLDHTSPEFLTQKIYGLADWFESDYSEFQLIANPGCYPTAVLLSLLPMVKNFQERIVSVSTSAYSGTSGAGLSSKAELSMSEMDGNIRAYNVHGHRHEIEISEQLRKYDFDSPFTFVTHLLPVRTGIYATSCLTMEEDMAPDEVQSVYERSYADSPFVRLRNQPPHLTWVAGTNFCDVHISVRGRSIVITAAIDNLIKGASGQAIQNLNKKMGWEETCGILNKELSHVSVY